MHSTVLVLALSTLLVPGHAGKTGCIYYNSLKGYDCNGNNLGDIPQDLSSSAKVLDISFNRIRELTRDSFQNYRSLEKLYLNDNMIMTIEPDTFRHLPHLDTLDLTMNALVELPPTILHLPSLKTLRLAKNIRLDILSFFNNAGQITAPLQNLDVSYNPMLTQLPNFGMMMDLVHLNITGIHLTNVSKAHFIGLCNLKIFTSVNLTMEFATVCDCAQIDRWFKMKNVKSYPEFGTRCTFAADKSIPECLPEDIEPSEQEIAMDQKCMTDFEVRETLRSAGQICLIVFGTIGGILLVVGICYIYYRFQRFSDDENKNVKSDSKTKTHLLIKNDLVNS